MTTESAFVLIDHLSVGITQQKMFMIKLHNQKATEINNIMKQIAELSHFAVASDSVFPEILSGDAIKMIQFLQSQCDMLVKETTDLKAQIISADQLLTESFDPLVAIVVTELQKKNVGYTNDNNDQKDDIDNISRFQKSTPRKVSFAPVNSSRTPVTTFDSGCAIASTAIQQKTTLNSVMKKPSNQKLNPPTIANTANILAMQKEKLKPVPPQEKRQSPQARVDTQTLLTKVMTSRQPTQTRVNPLLSQSMANRRRSING